MISSYLVSVVVPDTPLSDSAEKEVRKLADLLSRTFEYWEILLTVRPPGSGNVATPALFKSVANTRVICVRDFSSFYRVRAVAASEAIGDVVVLTTLDELPMADVAELASRAWERNGVAILTRAPRFSVAGACIGLLGQLTTYRLKPGDTMTMAFSRERLNLLLAQPDPELAIRFPHKRRTDDALRIRIEEDRTKRKLAHTGRRIQLLGTLFANAAPQWLIWLSMASFLVTVVALLYVAYAILIILLQTEVAPGWFTTALAQGFSAAFLGVSTAVLAMGLATLTDQIRGGLHHTTTDEVGAIDYFANSRGLNVEFEREPSATG